MIGIKMMQINELKDTGSKREIQGTIKNSPNFELAIDQKTKPIEYPKHTSCKPLSSEDVTHSHTESSIPTNSFSQKSLIQKQLNDRKNKEHIYCKPLSSEDVAHPCTGLCLKRYINTVWSPKPFLSLSITTKKRVFCKSPSYEYITHSRTDSE